MTWEDLQALKGRTLTIVRTLPELPDTPLKEKCKISVVKDYDEMDDILTFFESGTGASRSIRGVDIERIK